MASNNEQASLMMKTLDDKKIFIQENKNPYPSDDMQKRIERLEAALEVEKGLRMEQEKDILKLKGFQASIEGSEFVLVLIDADAEMYWFNDEYLKDGISGGTRAAQAFMAKVKEYLESTPGLVTNPNSVQVMVKAYANLEALEKACLMKGKIDNVGDLRRFWIGFTRAFSMCDFVDVGYGKEGADSKIRDVLNFNIHNVHCAHVLMACCHDTGYIHELEKCSMPAMAHRITLLKIGELRSEMKNLGFRTTKIFAPLFSFISEPVIDSSDPPQTEEGSLEMTFHQRLNLSIGRKASARNGNSRRDIHQQVASTKMPVNEQLDEFKNRITEEDLCLAHYAGYDCDLSPCPYNHNYRKKRSELSSQERTVIFDLYRRYWSHSKNLVQPNRRSNNEPPSLGGDWGYDSMLGQ